MPRKKSALKLITPTSSTRCYDAAKAWPDSFSTRYEAERHIAEKDLAGKKKARRFPSSGRWHLVTNTSGGVTISVAIQCAIVEARRQGLTMSVSEVARLAAHEFRALLKARRKARQ